MRFEYLVHRPGNPKTHSLSNGYPDQPNADLKTFQLAQELLKTAPFVGIEFVRSKLIMAIGRRHDGERPALSDFDQGGSCTRLRDHTIAYQEPEYVQDRIDALSVKQTSETTA